MSRFYLDACSLINLYATKQLTSMAKDLKLTFYITPWVGQRESLYVLEQGVGGKRNKVPIDLSEGLARGVIVQDAPLMTSEELSLLVQFAQKVDQGEAETMAAVISRGGTLITDDGAAIKLLAKEAPEIPLFTSISFIKHWSELMGIRRDTLKALLLDMQAGGNYIPGRREVHLQWWQEIINQT